MLQPILAPLIPLLRSALKSYWDIVDVAKSCVAERRQKMAEGKVDRLDMLSKLFKLSEEKDAFDVHDIENEAWIAMSVGVLLLSFIH